MPPKKKAKSKKAKPTQKQKQKQSQKVVINLAPPRKRSRKPRQTARPNTSRVLNQFIQPQAMLPSPQHTIFPVSLPPAFNPVQTPVLRNPVAPRPDGVVEGRILGRAPPETPLEVSNVLNSIAKADKLLSGKKEPDNSATQGRTLLPNRFWTGSARGDAGISSLSDTEVDVPSLRSLRRNESSTEAGLPRVEETDDEEFFGGSGQPSPSLSRRY